jgi:PAS domain S-box-containing protein
MSPEFLAGGGAMGARLAAFDWAGSPLGPIETWPQSLRTSLSIMLSSAFPTFVAWGPSLISFYNDAYVPILGAKEHGLGRPFPEVWAEVWDEIGPITDRAMQGEASFFEDMPLTLGRNGFRESTWFTFSYSPIRDETGGVAGVMCTVHETTGRMLAAAENERLVQEIAAEWARFASLIECLPFGAGLYDAEGRLVLGNPMLTRRLPEGTVPSVEAGARRAWAGIDASGQALAADQHPLYRALRGEVVQSVPILCRTAAGTERWMSVSGIPIRAAEGSVSHAVVVVQDINDAKRADEALRQSEERFRRFAENSTSVAWIVERASMRLEYVSPAFERVWGEKPDRILEDLCLWLDTIHPEDRAVAARAMERARNGEAWTAEYRIVRPDGAVRWIHDTCFPIPDETGRVARVGGLAQDITQHPEHRVYVVDEEQSSRQALSRALQGAGYEVTEFAAAARFVEVAPIVLPGCAVLDLRSGGLRTLMELKARRADLPVVAIGEAQGDVGFAVRVMKAGAADFLDMRLAADAIVDAVAAALSDVRPAGKPDGAAESARARIAGMSPRERAVLVGLLGGKTNKMIGREIGISPRTVEIHRAKVMQQLGAETLPEAVLMAAAAGLRPRAGPAEAS